MQAGLSMAGHACHFMPGEAGLDNGTGDAAPGNDLPSGVSLLSARVDFHYQSYVRDPRELLPCKFAESLLMLIGDQHAGNEVCGMAMHGMHGANAIADAAHPMGGRNASETLHEAVSGSRRLTFVALRTLTSIWALPDDIRCVRKTRAGTRKAAHLNKQSVRAAVCRRRCKR
jgi:hypothetical protein